MPVLDLHAGVHQILKIEEIQNSLHKAEDANHVLTRNSTQLSAELRTSGRTIFSLQDELTKYKEMVDPVRRELEEAKEALKRIERCP